MPPRPKYKKQEIVFAAYELTREKGIHAVVAREVGKKLNTSASPIFTVFNSMDDLKEAVREMAKKSFLTYMEGVFDYSPAFVEFGMRWIEFAQEEPNLYRLLFLMNQERELFSCLRRDFDGLSERLVKDMAVYFSVTQEQALRLFFDLVVLANGVAAFGLSGADNASRETINRLFNRICQSSVLTMRLRDGTLSPEDAKRLADNMASYGERLPVKRK